MTHLRLTSIQKRPGAFSAHLDHRPASIPRSCGRLSSNRAMSHTDRPKLDKLEAVQGFWDAHRRVLRARRVNLDKVAAEWAAKQARMLASPGAQTDFAELCTHGCVPQVLAGILALFRFAPRVKKLWAEMVGRPDKRQKATRTLEQAAAMLEDVLREFIAAEDESVRTALVSMERLPVSRLVSELRFYGQVLNWAEGLAADTEALN